MVPITPGAPLAASSLFSNAASGLGRLFSQDCQLCGSRGAASLCSACSRDLPRVTAGGCPSCAADGPPDVVCGACLADAPAFDRTVAAFHYAYPLDRLLQSYKFSANLALVSLFADALSGAVERSIRQSQSRPPDLVVALPLAPKRLAGRGFNQSALLAERTARMLGIDYAAHGLLKVRDTPPQAGLNRAARLKNVRGVFNCDAVHLLAGKHVAVVDDVMTTGATLFEAAKVLKKVGAVSVSAWVLARAGRERSNPAVAGDENSIGTLGDDIDRAVPF